MNKKQLISDMSRGFTNLNKGDINAPITMALQEIAIFPVEGRTGVTATDGTMVFSATEDLIVEATGDVTISVTRESDVDFRQHNVVISCPNDGRGGVIVKDYQKIRSYGNHRGTSDPNVNFYCGNDDTMPILHWNLNKLSLFTEKLIQETILLTSLPTTGNKALPVNLTFLYLWGDNINWTAFDGAGSGNITTFILINFLETDMNVEQLIQLLQSMAERVGNLPGICTIRNYDNNPTATAIRDATANETGTDAEVAKYWIEQIFNNKATTRVALQNVNIDKEE